MYCAKFENKIVCMELKILFCELNVIGYEFTLCWITSLSWKGDSKVQRRFVHCEIPSVAWYDIVIFCVLFRCIRDFCKICQDWYGRKVAVIICLDSLSFTCPVLSCKRLDGELIRAWAEQNSSDYIFWTKILLYSGKTHRYFIANWMRLLILSWGDGMGNGNGKSWKFEMKLSSNQ